MTDTASQPNAPEVTRAYGVLATSFTEALQDTRNALTDHQALLPNGRVADIDSMLEEFARRRVRVAIYGEVKAGKSTLMNALAGAVLSPTAFDPLTSVPVRVTYGAQTAWRVNGRSFASVNDLAEAMRSGMGKDAEVEVTTALDLLQLGGQVDIVDTPGVGSEDRFDVISSQVLRTLDAVILVVRYPALFTQYTRKLVDQLQTDISKLFVVWNLDGACSELSDEERTKQREILRENVAGAHQLYLVDAKRGFEAAREKSESQIAKCGLQSLIAGLAEFAGSNKREIAALREASKRSQLWLEETVRLLQERQTALETSLEATKLRLRTVERQGEERADEIRARFATLQAAVADVSKRQQTAAAEAATNLRKQLRLAGRRWVRKPDTTALTAAVQKAIDEYADAIDRVVFTSTDGLHQAARDFATTIAVAPRLRTAPTIDELCPADRGERARAGGVALLRRALWRNWYLSGLAALEGTAIDADVASQRQWIDDAVTAATTAARTSLDERLTRIRDEVETETAQIKHETDFVAESAEMQSLNVNVPGLVNVRAQINDIAAEAWYLGS